MALVANNDFATVPIGTPTTVNILANDTRDGAPVTLGDLDGLPVITQQPANGTCVVNPDGTVTYTPNPGYCGGTDVAIYSIKEAAGPPSDEFTFFVGGGPLYIAIYGGGVETDVVLDDGANLHHMGVGQHTFGTTPGNMSLQFVAGAPYAVEIGGFALYRVLSWGVLTPSLMRLAFGSPSFNWGSQNLYEVPATLPAQLTLLNAQFYKASIFNQDLPGWDVSAVTDMTNMFYDAAQYNQDRSDWCVTLIPSEPASFATGATAWVLPKPVWGTCP